MIQCSLWRWGTGPPWGSANEAIVRTCLTSSGPLPAGGRTHCVGAWPLTFPACSSSSWQKLSEERRLQEGFGTHSYTNGISERHSFPIYDSILCLPLAGRGSVFQANCLSVIYVRATQQGLEASTSSKLIIKCSWATRMGAWGEHRDSSPSVKGHTEVHAK